VDMSTSISGSGPAYIFMLMEAMIDAGVHMGFSRPVATTLVYHTLLGSTLYAMETGEHPAILRNQVTSPAGTTASAIYELENGKFRVVIKDVSITQSLATCPSVRFAEKHSLCLLSFSLTGYLGMLSTIAGTWRANVGSRSWKTTLARDEGGYSPPLECG
jgi:hypothetical protein